MKNQVITFAALMMLFSVTVSASSSKNYLKMPDAFGRTLIMPIVTEEPVNDSLPFDIEAIFHETRKEELNRYIDFSEMVKPEAEVDDISQKDKVLIGLK